MDENNVTPIIYDIVTSGTVWKFLKLEQNQVFIGIEEYYIKDINIILQMLG